MTTEGNGPRLGIASEGPRGFEEEMSVGVEAACDDLGWHHRRVCDGADEAAVDIVLAIGNARIYPDLVRRRPSARRILWHAETLPIDRPPSVDRWLHRTLPTGRLLDFSGRVAPRFGRTATFARWREVAAMERETTANLRVLRRAAGAFDQVVIDSADRARGARAANLPASIIPFGYHAAFAGPMVASGARDLPVLMLGHLPGKHGRRQRILRLVEAGLADHGIPVTRVTGGSTGAPRRALLERTRVVLDIHRVPGNHPMFRFIVATAAGAALVSEPLRDPAPLVPGYHYHEAPGERLGAAVRALLADEPARLRLVQAAQELISGELHLSRIVPRLVALVPPVEGPAIIRP